MEAPLLDGTVVPVFATAAMREADRATIEEFGIPSFTLMERAALGAFEFLAERYAPIAERDALVFAGAGGNGGDGLALARMLACAGASVTVVTTADGDVREDTAKNLELLERLVAAPGVAPITVHRVERGSANEDTGDRLFDALAAFSSYDFCVDAVLGIGARTELDPPEWDLCRHVQIFGEASGVETIALDLPSGVDSDSGRVGNSHVHASVTLAFGAPKPGHLFGEGRERSGEVHVLDIGIPPHLAERAVRSKGSALLATDDWVRARLPHRDFDAHKFSAGQVLAVCGSDRYPGAAALASAAAARAGAGYVVCATSERAKDAVDAQCPEVAAVAVERSDAAARALVEEHGRARAVLLGPGLGAPDEESTRAFVRALVESVWDAHLIVDADGLNALADDAGRAALRAAAERLSLAGDGGSDEGCGVVLTPHPGEFARLAGRPASGDPLADARALATDLGAVVVLKGAPTVVATPGKHPPFVAREVEPALATAGSGDVLAGLVAGFAAQNATALEAAVLGVHVGGLAAERACHDRAARSVVASGVVAEVPAALDALEGDRAVR